MLLVFLVCELLAISLWDVSVWRQALGWLTAGGVFMVVTWIMDRIFIAPSLWIRLAGAIPQEDDPLARTRA